MAKVKIYTTPSCVYCRMAKDYFKKAGVEYEELDVARDERAREEMVKKSQQLGVPVIEIGNQVFVGFNRIAIEKAIRQ
ncbi:MAG: Glutaredoxin-like protein, YruB-family [Parcubacteria group bacterium GW2011_GWC1_45_9]|nr:MAG: Glutaredoxin-like protein, YruB-family [Parcubacteria group bacterium GW2011_GWB1_45_10]KKU16446.1 MAG: Glutaredoxin-like protein, YruB-family [Parcubacteria group bacterium GW2011_GWC1_45_9]